MQFINYLLDASEDLLTWDLTDQGFDLAARNRACLLAGIDLTEIGDKDAE